MPIAIRRIWVKRPGGSPTQVLLQDDDYVDTLRDLCLRKFSNGLGKQFDSPDLMIKILPSIKNQASRQRHGSHNHAHTERLLAPEEIMSKVLEDYYPGGQTAEDALIVDVPQSQRRTPRPSPGHASYSYAYGQGAPSLHDVVLPHEVQDYFGTPMVNLPPLPHSTASSVSATGHQQLTGGNAMSIIAHTPPVPGSPGPGRRQMTHRPNMRARTHTSSPTVSNASAVLNGPAGGVMLMPRGTQGRSRGNSDTSPVNQPFPIVVPTSPGPAEIPNRKADSPIPPPRVASPRPANKAAAKKVDKNHSGPTGTLDGQVPAINVLIVEDNIINLKLLEAFMKRLKVRWQTAMNGKEAVTKWRTGGFHLVLMDIQLPIMNGLEATKEIRRLERVNSIGSFSSNPITDEVMTEADKLDTSVVFKSSVIIVALTASSLQSDRHEALAAGCNDFLTKPVNFIFLERKVTEWGCMQALIDFEGWHKWKDLSSKQTSTRKGFASASRNRGSGAKASTSKSIAAKEKETPVLELGSLVAAVN